MRKEQSWSYHLDRLPDAQCREMLVEVLDMSRKLMLDYRDAYRNESYSVSEEMQELIDHCRSMSSAHNDTQNHAMAVFDSLISDELRK